MLRFCRDTNKYLPETVAAALGITVNEYRKMETGQKMPTSKQISALEQLFGIRGHYFYLAALQLDLLLTASETVRLQQEMINELKADEKKTNSSY